MRKFLLWIVVILWMVIIFKLSSQPATQSGKLSTGIAKINIKAINKVDSGAKFNIVKVDHILRKNAHFFVYLVLGVVVINALRRKSIALLICVLYAISDELHQAFVPGRGPGVMDVFIDSAGALVGILIYLGISRLKKKVSLSKCVNYVKE